MSNASSIVSNRRDGSARPELETGATPTIRPAYRVKEKDDGFGLTVYLPGVPKAGLEITAEADQLRIIGRRSWKQPEGWTQIHRESTDAPFELVLEHGDSFDADKAEAEFRDGVLRLALPKAEALKPKKIKIS
ncbi:MAG TPA: Hsp20/alpha crystallin family protein [Tepidisphaeraceae bacterium]|nr:Hsp20/alpha crystallin family protein [Tepidisphaeraceae bacterium]